MKTGFGPVCLAIAFVLLTTSSSSGASGRDGRIEASARNSYVFQTFLKQDRITVRARRGVVFLTGTVSDEFAKSLAQETVAGLPGVKSVVNRLESKGGRLADSSDAWIATKVKTALRFRRDVNANRTEVSAKDGVVTLKGVAISQAQRDLTEEYAKNVEGVKEVRNELVVSPTAKETYEAAMRGRIDDASIRAQVRMALLFHGSTSVVNTTVYTVGGVVTLRGVARSAAEKDLVSTLASDIQGVKSIKNEMTVEESK